VTAVFKRPKVEPESGDRLLLDRHGDQEVAHGCAGTSDVPSGFEEFRGTFRATTALKSVCQREDAPPAGRRLGDLVGPGVVVVAFLGLLALSWRRWPDVLVDFGRELYVPWQLSSGKVLYRDIAHIAGPLSQYVNAAAFRLFGVSLMTLVSLNLLILVALTVAIYEVFQRIHGGALTPTVACLAFLVLSGFSHSIGFGNYNFVCPYSHELTHGTALTIAMILCLGRWIERGSFRASAGAGLCLGLVALTKAEVFVAALACTAAGIALRALAKSSTPAGLWRDLASLSAASALPAVGFFAFFRHFLPSAGAARAVLGAFTPIFASEVTGSVFYVHGMGLDQPGHSVTVAFAYASCVVFLLAALLILETGLANRKGPRARYVLAGAGMVVLLLGLRQFHPRFLLVPEALPVLVIPLAGAAFLRAWWLRDQPDPFARAALAALWATFALTFLLKIALRVRADDYGFALAMPASLLFVGRLLGAPPSAPTEPARSPRLRALILIFLVVDLGATAAQSAHYYGHKTHPEGRGADTFFAYDRDADPRGDDVALALERIEARIPPGAPFVVLPEGVMLNYLSRRPSPTRYLSFMPPEVAIHGEATMLAALEASRPGYVVLAHRWTGEYGVGYFGADASYGKTILDWVREHYEVFVRVDHVPFRGRYEYGLEILRRR
jgi:hypothetical protein